MRLEHGLLGLGHSEMEFGRDSGRRQPMLGGARLDQAVGMPGSRDATRRMG